MRPVRCPRATYQRHQPERTVLYRTIATRLPTFFARPAWEDGTGGWPAFVRREFEAYLKCGRLEHGLLRVQCERCGDTTVVAFSCRGRGFLGTGAVEELGVGAGRGYSVYLPLQPYTDDVIYLEAFDAVVPRVAAAFRPDVVVAQLGIDSHRTDPLTHLALTVDGFAEAVRPITMLAPRLVALGGGGYDLGNVARAWTVAWAPRSTASGHSGQPKRCSGWENSAFHREPRRVCVFARTTSRSPACTFSCDGSSSGATCPRCAVSPRRAFGAR